MTDVGKCIRIAQMMTGIKNKEIADHFGVVRQQVWRWQQAKDLKLSTVEGMSQLFNMNIQQFISLGDTNEKA